MSYRILYYENCYDVPSSGPALSLSNAMAHYDVMSKDTPFYNIKILHIEENRVVKSFRGDLKLTMNCACDALELI